MTQSLDLHLILAVYSLLSIPVGMALGGYLVSRDPNPKPRFSDTKGKSTAQIAVVKPKGGASNGCQKNTASMSSPRRSLGEEIALRGRWKTEARFMWWDIEERCDYKCQEGVKPCDIYEKIQELHKQNQSPGHHARHLRIRDSVW